MIRFFRNISLFLLLFQGICLAQTVRITNRTQELIFDSEYLNEKRKILVQLPESYFDSKHNYPTVYVLDADHLFDPVVGFVHYYSYLDSMPETIVIGISQENNEQDLTANKIAFRKFMLKELIPYINESYKPTDFKTIIANEKSANFLPSLMTKDTSFFNAFVGMSPNFTQEDFAHLDTIFPIIDTTSLASNTQLDSIYTPIKLHLDERFYFSAGEDTKVKKAAQAKMSQFLQERAPSYLHWNHETFEGKSTATLPIVSIPQGIAYAFKGYRELDTETWKKIEAGEIDGITEIQLHYKKTERLLGTPVKISMNELLKLSKLYATQEKFNQIVELGDFAMDIFPEVGTSYFIAGQGQEGLKNYREALNYYEMGHAKINNQSTAKQNIEEEITRLKDLMAKTGK